MLKIEIVHEQNKVGRIEKDHITKIKNQSRRINNKGKMLFQNVMTDCFLKCGKNDRKKQNHVIRFHDNRVDQFACAVKQYEIDQK